MKSAFIESLENRQLLSSSVGPIGPISPTSPTALSGVVIHAEATQAFKAVVGSITGVAASSTGLPTGYSYYGSIEWGDNTASSPAIFVSAPHGVIDVEGSHTYTKATSASSSTSTAGDAITVTVLREPPAGSTGTVVVVGTIHSSAAVITPDGGVTLNELASTSFTATLGTFKTSLAVGTLTATITWGDGTVSTGKIVAVGNTSGAAGAGAGAASGEFEVVGTHSYSAAASYPVHVTITAPSSSGGSGATNPIVVSVAQFDSVIDVLPVSAVAVGGGGKGGTSAA